MRSLRSKRVKQRERDGGAARKTNEQEEKDEEKHEGIEEVAGDTEEKRRREKDEETRGRDPEYKPLQSLAVSPLRSGNRSTLETRTNEKKKKTF